MPFANYNVSVGPNAVKLADLVSTSGGATVVLLNSDATFATAIGGSNVTVATGFPLKAGASLTIQLVGTDAVYAITGGTTNTVVVNVARSGT